MKKFKLRKLNNDGSALVVAIVAVGFISILATLLLFSANMNYHMKGTDYYTKQTFYEAEIPMEQIRACLSKDVSEASKVAYIKTLYSYGNDADARKAAFYSNFKSEYIGIWNKRNSYTAGDGSTASSYAVGVSKAIEETAGSSALNDYHILINAASTWDEAKMECKSTTCSKPYHILLDSVGSEGRLWQDEKDSDGDGTDEAFLRFDNVRVIYTKDEYTSIIKTDFCIACPEINWSVQKTMDDTDPVSKREEVDFETFVTYMDWEKQ